MIEGIWAPILNLLTLNVLVFVMSLLGVSVFIGCYKNTFSKINSQHRKFLLWLYVLTPWLISVLVSLLFIATGFFTPDTPLNTVAHWHHKNSFELMSWHSFSLSLFIMLLCFLVVKKFRNLMKHYDEIQLLHEFSVKKHADFYTIEAKQASAFTCGLIKQYCFLSTGLLEKITEDEKNIILHHELAHAQAKDPLKKWLFSFFAAFFIPSLKNYLITNMTLAMEQEADQAVVLAKYAPTCIASTLVKVARLSSHSPAYEMSHHFSMELLEQRVHYLLGLQEAKPCKLILPLTTFIAFTLLTILSIDSLHHFIERFLN